MAVKKKIKSIFNLKGKIETWKLYFSITDIGEISRRYFVMNLFDGVLTILGLLIGNFVLYTTGHFISRESILIPAFSMAAAIGISGISAGYLTERAERKKNIHDLRHAMALPPIIGKEKIPSKKNTLVFREEDYYPVIHEEKPIKQDEIKQENKIKTKENLQNESENKQKKIYQNNSKSESIYESELQNELKSKNDIASKKENLLEFKSKAEVKENDEKKEKTLAEKAESFASLVASLINGLAPVAGGIVGLIPLYILPEPTTIVYISSFVLQLVILFGLGYFLAKVSQGSILSFGFKMVLAGVVVAVLSFLIGGG